MTWHVQKETPIPTQVVSHVLQSILCQWIGSIEHQAGVEVPITDVTMNRSCKCFSTVMTRNESHDVVMTI